MAMTFPRDTVEGTYKAEDHSTLSVVLVSTVMIAMTSLGVVTLLV